MMRRSLGKFFVFPTVNIGLVVSRFASTKSSHPDFLRSLRRGRNEVDDNGKWDIGNDVKQHSVVVFMKGVPDAPQCGFSKLVVDILRREDVSFVSFNVMADSNLRDAVKKYSDWPTIPQVYVKGEFIGGSDIVDEMYKNGKLTKLLKEKGVKQ